jgi:hypothetical protein
MTKAIREHRRHPRFALGLPVKLRLAGRAESITVELMDLSEAGGCFRATGDEVHVDDRAAFGFVIPGQRHCVASGRCVRVRASGEFALYFDRANEAFRGFVANLSGQPPPA